MISTAIMAHPQREAWAHELSARLDAPIVWDQRNDRVDTGLRSLAAYDPEATHHLIVQDDAIVCRDLVPALERAAEVAEDRILGLYIGNGRPLSKFRLDQIARGADAAGANWIEWRGTIWGVAIAVPVAHIEGLMRSYQRQAHGIQNYDTRLENAARTRGVGWWYPWPSLVDHRTGPANPSLVPGRTNGHRCAYRFIGADTSALDLDWSSRVFHA